MKLSLHERGALCLLAHGRHPREIALVMGVAEGTVKTFLTRATKKLRASHRPHAVALAVQAGLIPRHVPRSFADPTYWRKEAGDRGRADRQP